MIGRSEVLKQLDHLMRAAEHGDGALVLVSGDAGIGKTRLVEEAIAGCGLVALRGSAPAHGATPYGPIVAALRDHLRRAKGRPFDGPLSEHLGSLLPEVGAPSETCDRPTLFEAIAYAFRTIAREQPTVAFLDDLHWADAATVEMLPSLATMTADSPLLFVAAYRSDELPRGHPVRGLRVELRRAGRFNEIVLEPLDVRGTAELTAHVLRLPPGRSLVAAIHDRTEGIPFFVEELAAALAAGGRLVETGSRLELSPGMTVPLPESIRDATRVRTELLSPEARASLQAAAVIGVRVPLDHLAGIGGDGGLGALVEVGLLSEVEPGVAQFRHDLIREAVYADAPWPQRRRLHGELAELLDRQGGEPRLIADHWLAAGDAARARPVLLEAARRFCAVHAYRDAAGAGRVALELWPENEDEAGRLAALDELGRCAELCGEWPEAARVWEEVADNERDAHRRAVVIRQLATVYNLQGRSAAASDAHAQAAVLFEANGLDAEAAAERLALADSLFPAESAAALDQLERALTAAKRAGRQDLQSRALSSTGYMLGATGNRDRGFAAARAALATATADGDVTGTVDAYWTIGTIANFWAEYGKATDAFESAATLCREHGRRPDEASCVACLGLVLFERGDWSAAEELARQSKEAPDAPAPVRAHADWIVGIICALRGGTKRGRSLLRRVLADAERFGLPMAQVQSTLGLALVDELEGRPSDLWRGLLDSPPPFLSLTYVSGFRWASTFGARRGDVDLVRACAHGLAEWSARYGSPDALAGLAHALGEVSLLEAATERAVDQFMRATELLRGAGAVFELAHSRSRAGVALIEAGDREVGVGELVDAHHTFRRLHARPFAHRVAAELEAHGEQVASSLGRRAARELEHGGLSRREVEVLRLVAVGRTNREIAHELFLSSRTVDMHVRSILTKLTCASRTEAAMKAHRLGLITTAAAEPRRHGAT